MEHIKAPVSMSENIDIVDADGYLILKTLSYSPAGIANIAFEAIHVLNEHDGLMAQRDDLIVQRAALVAACESVLESMDIATEGFGDSIANGMFKGAFFGVRKQIVAALALVKGDTDD